MCDKTLQTEHREEEVGEACGRKDERAASQITCPSGPVQLYPTAQKLSLLLEVSSKDKINKVVMASSLYMVEVRGDLGQSQFVTAP